MGKAFSRLLVAVQILFVGLLVVPSLMVITGCEDANPASSDTVRITDTLTDTATITDTLTDTATITDTVTVDDTLFEDGMKILRDADIDSGETLTLSKDTVYLLDGFVFVENTATIVIPAGTVIKAKPGGGLNASALIICVGGTILAQGSATEPIIMTAQQDDLTDPEDLVQSTRGLWGGLIILGDANTNKSGGTNQIEGITATDPRGIYGGGSSPDLDDSSGVIQYVSIRFGGSNIGEGNEINGLTMGAVGNRTVIDHVEVYNNNDDGFEWFGGTVNCKYLISAGNADDSFDWDEGYKGNLQFLFVIQDASTADRAFECDGVKTMGDSDYSAPTIYNATIVGSGAGSKNNGNMAFKLREETGGIIANSIVTDFPGDLKVSSGTVQYTGVINFDNSKGNDGTIVTDKVLGGQLVIKGNLFYSFGYDQDSTKILKYSKQDPALMTSAEKTSIDSMIVVDNLFSTDPGLTITRDDDGNLTTVSPVPTAAAALTNAKAQALPAGTFWTAATYCGAFNTGDTWHTGWTAITDAYGAQ